MFNKMLLATNYVHIMKMRWPQIADGGEFFHPPHKAQGLHLIHALECSWGLRVFDWKVDSFCATHMPVLGTPSGMMCLIIGWFVYPISIPPFMPSRAPKVAYSREHQTIQNNIQNNIISCTYFQLLAADVHDQGILMCLPN